MIYLGLIAILEFVYIVYSDHVNRRERERLMLFKKSKTVDEYIAAVEKPEKPKPQKPDPYVEIDQVPEEQLLQAEDNL